MDHRWHPCFPINGNTACFCLNYLTHHWLKRQLILDFSRSVTSSCGEGINIHLLRTVLPCPAHSQGATATWCAAGSILPVGLRCILSWEGTRTAQRCQVRDLLPFGPPSLCCSLLDLEGMQCPVPRYAPSCPDSAFFLSLLLPPSQEHWLHPFCTVPYNLELLASAGVAAGSSCTFCLVSFL